MVLLNSIFREFGILQVCNIFDYLGALSSAFYGLIMVSIAVFFIFGSVTIVKKAKIRSDRKVQEEADRYEISDKLKRLQKLDMEQCNKKEDIEDSTEDYKMRKF